jgi:hypothetical protein
VTNNNRFWIGWLDLLALLLQLHPIITAHNQCLSKTRSIPYWTTIVFSSTATNLVPIYESVISSASVVRWLTIHSWTLNWTIELPSQFSYDWMIELTNELSWTLESIMCPPFITLGEQNIDHHLKHFLCYSLFIRCYETCVNSVATLRYLQAFSLPWTRALASRCLAMTYSGFQASCHNITRPLSIQQCVWSWVPEELSRYGD